MLFFSGFCRCLFCWMILTYIEFWKRGEKKRKHSTMNLISTKTSVAVVLDGLDGTSSVVKILFCIQTKCVRESFQEQIAPGRQKSRAETRCGETAQWNCFITAEPPTTNVNQHVLSASRQLSTDPHSLGACTARSCSAMKRDGNKFEFQKPRNIYFSYFLLRHTSFFFTLRQV